MLSTFMSSQQSHDKARSSLKPKPKTQAKKKSNLELFKEEIKAKHDASEAMRAEAKKKAELTGQTGSFNNPLIPNAVSDQVLFVILPQFTNLL